MADLEKTYSAYAADVRKQRAWRADSVGNAAMRTELVRAMLDVLLPAMGDHGRALDVGCGTGWWLRELACAGIEPGRLNGVDALAGRVNAARRSVPGADVRVADACALPWPASAFAAVSLLVVLSSMPEERAVISALTEARRVLAPGGVVVVWEPRVLTPRNPRTRLVSRRILGRGLGPELESRSLTVLPALARRIRSPEAYRRLAAIPLLRTHRLVIWRAPRARG